MKPETPNKITGANAGGPRQLPMRTRWAARVAQFCRSAKNEMDTDDLTPMAYKTLSLADDTFEPMRAQIGMAAADYGSEDEFLSGVTGFLAEILEDPQEYLDEWAILEESEKDKFVEGVRRIQAHVAATLSTSRKQRGKPPFEN